MKYMCVYLTEDNWLRIVYGTLQNGLERIEEIQRGNQHLAQYIIMYIVGFGVMIMFCLLRKTDKINKDGEKTLKLNINRNMNQTMFQINNIIILMEESRTNLNNFNSQYLDQEKKSSKQILGSSKMLFCRGIALQI